MIPILDREFEQRRDEGNRRVVDQDIDAAEFLQRRPRRGHRLVGTCEIGLDGEAFAPETFDRRSNFREPCPVAPNCRDVGASVCQHLAGFKTDALCGARD